MLDTLLDFIATYDSGQEGPVIGYLAEYDALPGLGHACGHNIIGTASVLAGSALKQVIDRIGGKVVVLGCPAEEGGEMVVQKLHMLGWYYR